MITNGTAPFVSTINLLAYSLLNPISSQMPQMKIPWSHDHVQLFLASHSNRHPSQTLPLLLQTSSHSPPSKTQSPYLWQSPVVHRCLPQSRGACIYMDSIGTMPKCSLLGVYSKQVQLSSKVNFSASLNDRRNVIWSLSLRVSVRWRSSI